MSSLVSSLQRKPFSTAHSYTVGEQPPHAWKLPELDNPSQQTQSLNLVLAKFPLNCYFTVLRVERFHGRALRYILLTVTQLQQEVLNKSSLKNTSPASLSHPCLFLMFYFGCLSDNSCLFQARFYTWQNMTECWKKSNCTWHTLQSDWRKCKLGDVESAGETLGWRHKLDLCHSKWDKTLNDTASLRTCRLTRRV